MAKPDSSAPQPPEEPSPGYCWRLTFRYRGDDVELVSRERIEMLPPPPDPESEEAGFRVELHGATDLPLFTQRVHNPIRRELEVFSSDPDKPMTYVPVPDPVGAFQVIVPDLPGAEELVLATTVPPTDQQDPFAEARRDQSGKRPMKRELVRVALREPPDLPDPSRKANPRPRKKK